MRKPAFCMCENKGADQLRDNPAAAVTGNRAADQCLYFRYIDCTIPLLPKSETSSLVCVRPGKIMRKTGFVTTQLINQS